MKISPLVLLNLIPEAVFILDPEHIALFNNEAAKPYLVENNRLEIELRIGWSRSVTVVKSNGEQLPADIWVSTVIWEDTPAFFGAAAGISRCDWDLFINPVHAHFTN